MEDGESAHAQSFTCVTNVHPHIFFFRVTLAEQRENREIFLKKRKREKHINEIKTPSGRQRRRSVHKRSHRLGSRTL